MLSYLIKIVLAGENDLEVLVESSKEENTNLMIVKSKLQSCS